MLYCACEKPKTYPDTPAIQFVSLAKERGVLRPDSNSIITISFTDGDGDIGLNSYDTLAPYNLTSVYYDDFIVSLFQKVNGAWVEDTAFKQPNGLSPFCGRLPYLTPTGSNKALSGNISMTQPIWLYPVTSDTIHYQVYIFDRALHRSNMITTNDIVITSQLY